MSFKKCPSCKHRLSSGAIDMGYEPLPSVTLKLVPVLTCTNCNYKRRDLPNFWELDCLIVNALRNEPHRLMPSEKKFLNQHAQRLLWQAVHILEGCDRAEEIEEGGTRRQLVFENKKGLWKRQK